MNLPPVTRTPVGSSSLAAALAAVAAALLPLWPAYSHLPTSAQAAIGAALVAVAGLLGGWQKVASAPGQQVRMSLTASPLPAVQEVPLDDPVPPGAKEADDPAATAGPPAGAAAPAG